MMNATDTIEAISRSARERYRKEARFRVLTESIVNRVMQEHGRVDPDDADRDAHHIATRVAAMVIELLYLEDQELGAQRQIAEGYKKIAEDALASMPMMPMMPLTIGAANLIRNP